MVSTAKKSNNRRNFLHQLVHTILHISQQKLRVCKDGKVSKILEKLNYWPLLLSIIVYSRSIINTCSFLSHEWWVQLIKFMVGPTIHVRGVEHAFMVLREYLIIFHYRCGSDWDIKLDICKIKRLSYPWFDFLGKSISSKTIRLVLEIM